MTEFYYLPELFNIIKEYLISDYSFLRELSNQWMGLIGEYFTDQQGKEIRKRTNTFNDPYKQYTNNCEFLETVEYTCENSNSILVTIPYFNSEYFYKNLRFDCDFENVQSIELDIGGQRMAYIDMEYYDVLQKFYEMKGIPFYIFKYGFITCGFHRGEITFRLKKLSKLRVLVDKYLNKQYHPNLSLTLQTFKYYTYHHDIMELNVKEKDNEINIWRFQNIIYVLLCNHKLTNIRLILNNKEFRLYQYGQIIRLTNEINSEKISNFGFNGSRFNNIQLKFDSPESNNIKLWCIKGNILMYKSGLCGYRYMP
jgi:hypothetical protein